MNPLETSTDRVVTECGLRNTPRCKSPTPRISDFREGGFERIVIVPGAIDNTTDASVRMDLSRGCRPGSCVFQMLAEPLARGIRKHCHPVPAALRAADGEVAEVGIDILNSESEALENAHAGAVEQQDHELGGPLEMRQSRRHFVAATCGYGPPPPAVINRNFRSSLGGLSRLTASSSILAMWALTPRPSASARRFTALKIPSSREIVILMRRIINGTHM